MSSIVANTELFEMILGMMPMALDTKNIKNHSKSRKIKSGIELEIKIKLNKF